MRGILHVTLQDMRLMLVDRAAIFFLLIMPIGFIFFFGTVFRDGGDPSSVTVSLPVINEDDEFLSYAFVDQLEAESFNVETYTPAQADSVDFDARVARIPAGFTNDVLRGEPTQLNLTKRANSSVSYDAAAEILLHQAQVRFLGNLIRWNPPPAENGVAPQISEVDKGRFIALVAQPSAVTVESRYAGKGRPVPSGMGQSVPGMLTMFVVMTVLIGGSAAITKEKEEGTLRRLATTTLTRNEIIFGKLGGLIVTGLVQAGILIVVTEVLGRFQIAGMTFVWGKNIPVILPLLLAYSFCVGSIGLFLSGLFRTTQQAESLSWLVGMVFAGLGGCWWPMEIVPKVFQTVGHIFPTAWTMDGLHGVITFGHGFSATVVPTIVLLLYGAVFAALGARSMRVAT